MQLDYCAIQGQPPDLLLLHALAYKMLVVIERRVKLHFFPPYLPPLQCYWPKLALVVPKLRFNQLLMFIIFQARAKSRQFCGGISLQIGCVTGLQALPIGPDMDVYMAGDCCGLI